MTATGPLTIALAMALDAVFGDPPNRLHPVAWFGRLVNTLMRFAPATGRSAQLAFGTLVGLGLTSLGAALGLFVERALVALPTWAAIMITALALDMTLALRGLYSAARTMLDALEANALADARRDLGALCSRDASSLEEHELLSGTIASLAENASDSVIAPLFYYALFGLPGAFAFRALNTLDAMLGYRDHREYLGKASARLDDLAGLVPARLSALTFILVAPLVRADIRRGIATWWHASSKTPSPNGGHPMSVMAGLLDIVIDKPGVYTLGTGSRPERTHVMRAFRIVAAACLLFALGCALVLGARHV